LAGTALAAADVLQRLLHLPHVPLQHAQQLIAAGVRISHAQLLAATRDVVAGVEVWVQAQQDLGITSDLPAAAVAICCGREWVSFAHNCLLPAILEAFCTLQCPLPVCIKLHTHITQSPRLLAAYICSTARHGDQPHTLCHVNSRCCATPAAAAAAAAAAAERHAATSS
jgi:hypothetical protein